MFMLVAPSFHCTPATIASLRTCCPCKSHTNIAIIFTGIKKEKMQMMHKKLVWSSYTGGRFVGPNFLRVQKACGSMLVAPSFHCTPATIASLRTCCPCKSHTNIAIIFTGIKKEKMQMMHKKLVWSSYTNFSQGRHRRNVVALRCSMTTVSRERKLLLLEFGFCIDQTSEPKVNQPPSLEGRLPMWPGGISSFST